MKQLRGDLGRAGLVEGLYLKRVGSGLIEPGEEAAEEVEVELA